jgi:hypothetical protein
MDNQEDAMPRMTLADKQAKFARDKAKLEVRETALRLQVRRARNRELKSAGEMVERAGLLRLRPDELGGALLEVEAGASDEATLKRWARTWRKAQANGRAEEEAAPTEKGNGFIETVLGSSAEGMPTAE